MAPSRFRRDGSIEIREIPTPLIINGLKSGTLTPNCLGESKRHEPWYRRRAMRKLFIVSTLKFAKTQNDNLPHELS